VSLTYSLVGAAPTWLSINSVSGALYGTPVGTGTISGIRIRATNQYGAYVDSNDFAIVVEPYELQVPSVDIPRRFIADDVKIANLALTKIGAQRITSLLDNTESARTVYAVFDAVRDAELRRHNWRFSLKRAALPSLSETPAFGYAHAYQLPADCIKILSVGDYYPGYDFTEYRVAHDAEEYAVEGRTILSNDAAPLNLRYVSSSEDSTQYDAAFVAALAARLAYEIVEALSQSRGKKEAVLQDYRLSITEAIRSNSIESPTQQIPDDSWLLSRQ
jgi:hypothetical protein